MVPPSSDWAPITVRYIGKDPGTTPASPLLLSPTRIPK